MSKIAALIGVACCVLPALAPAEGTVTQAPRSHWMEGKYGLMVPWLAPNFDTTRVNKTPLPEKGAYKADSNDAVNGFDVQRFMREFDLSGATWLIFTIGQNSGTYN